MKKETLTMEKIKQDHKNKYLNNKKVIWIGLIVSMISAAILLAMSIHSFLIFKTVSFFDRLPLIALCVLCVYIGIIGLFSSYRDNIDIGRGTAKIVTDKLVGSVEGAAYYSTPVAALSSKPYSLEFAMHGEYSIGRTNNTFSEDYYMSDVGVYLSSKQGDMFYLVIGRKGKILLAYNTKFFELQN